MARRKNKRSNPDKTQVQNTEVLPESAYDRAVIFWYAPEFLRFRKGLAWYVIAGLLNALVLAYAIWTQSYTMAAVFMVLPAVFMLEQRHKPKTVGVKISQFGIRFGEIRVPYSDIKSFWIIHQPPYVDELHLLINSRTQPEITIPLVGTDPTLLRQYLVSQIPEWEGKKQSFMDILSRFIKLD